MRTLDFVLRPGSGAAVAAVLVASLAIDSPNQDGKSPFNTTGYPEDMVAAARLTERRCTKCHSIQRVVTTEYGSDEWAEAVDRMAKKEKSGISRKEAATITKFLSFHSQGGKAKSTAEVQRPKDENLGGPAVFAAPAAALYSYSTLSVADALPVAIDLGDLKCKVESLVVTPGEKGSITVTAGIVCGEEKGSVSLTRNEEGEQSFEALPVRSWTIGPHVMSLKVALYFAEAPFATDARPLVRFATIVTRDG